MFMKILYKFFIFSFIFSTSLTYPVLSMTQTLEQPELNVAKVAREGLYIQTFLTLKYLAMNFDSVIKEVGIEPCNKLFVEQRIIKLSNHVYQSVFKNKLLDNNLNIESQYKQFYESFDPNKVNKTVLTLIELISKFNFFINQIELGCNDIFNFSCLIRLILEIYFEKHSYCE